MLLSRWISRATLTAQALELKPKRIRRLSLCAAVGTGYQHRAGRGRGVDYHISYFAKPFNLNCSSLSTREGLREPLESLEISGTERKGW